MGWQVKLAATGAVALAILLACLRLIGIGRDQERGKSAVEGMRRTQDANAARAEASQPVTAEEEANDPFNRDHL